MTTNFFLSRHKIELSFAKYSYLYPYTGSHQHNIRCGSDRKLSMKMIIIPDVHNINSGCYFYTWWYTFSVYVLVNMDGKNCVYIFISICMCGCVCIILSLSASTLYDISVSVLCNINMRLLQVHRIDQKALNNLCKLNIILRYGHI